jgi:hypothetical protein
MKMTGWLAAVGLIVLAITAVRFWKLTGLGWWARVHATLLLASIVSFASRGMGTCSAHRLSFGSERWSRRHNENETSGFAFERNVQRCATQARSNPNERAQLLSSSRFAAQRREKRAVIKCLAFFWKI